MKIVAIIPAYNEEENIVKVIAGVKKYLKNIIVVDDGSKDNTVEAAKAQNITVLHHIINLGKGAALKTGIEYSDADAFILIDADMQHSPEHIPEFIIFSFYIVDPTIVLPMKFEMVLTNFLSYQAQAYNYDFLFVFCLEF